MSGILQYILFKTPIFTVLANSTSLLLAFHLVFHSTQVLSNSYTVNKHTPSKLMLLSHTLKQVWFFSLICVNFVAYKVKDNNTN